MYWDLGHLLKVELKGGLPLDFCPFNVSPTKQQKPSVLGVGLPASIIKGLNTRSFDKQGITFEVLYDGKVAEDTLRIQSPAMLIFAATCPQGVSGGLQTTLVYIDTNGNRT